MSTTKDVAYVREKSMEQLWVPENALCTKIQGGAMDAAPAHVHNQC